MPNEYYYLNHNNPLNHYNQKKLPEPAYVIAPEVSFFITYLISYDWD